MTLALTLKQKSRRKTMRAIEISGQWYVVRDDSTSKRGFAVVDGPYPEKWQAISAARLLEIES